MSHFDSLLRAKLRDPEVMAGYLASRSRYRRAVVESANVTVPHAAEVSAVVARLWHLGLAEDAERRGKPWHELASKPAHMWGYAGDHPQDMADYFDGLAASHRQAAEKVTR